MEKEVREKIERLGEAANLMPQDRQDFILGYAAAIKDLRPEREQEKQ